MAGKIGTEKARIIAALKKDPGRRDLFLTLQRLEALHPDKNRIGHSRHLRDDVVRFCQKTSMSFLSSSMDSFVEDDSDAPPKLFVNFMGLTGVNGPLPLNFTEMVKNRQLHHKDDTHAAFLDMLSNRVLALFYRSWAHSQLTASYNKNTQQGFSRYIASLTGHGRAPFLARDTVQDNAKRHYVGWLAMQTSTPEGLSAILASYFRVPVEIDEFIGQWIAIPEESLCYLGHSPATGVLGETAVIGKRFWDRQQKFRIRMGPMGFARYLSMLPSGDKLTRLVDWVRNYVGEELEWDACLVLKRNEVPPIRLGRQGQLGWTTWLQNEWTVFKNDQDQLLMDRATRDHWSAGPQIASISLTRPAEQSA